MIDGRIIFRPQARGIARSVIGLVSGFPAGADGRVRLLVPTEGSTPFELADLVDRVDLVETAAPVVPVRAVTAMRRLLRRLNAGVLFTPYHPFTPLAAPCPVVSMVHDCIWEEDPAFAGGRPRQLAYEVLSQLTLTRAAAIVVPSMSTAHAVARHYPWAPRSELVPNGVTWPADDDKPDPEAARRELGLPDRYLLHVGARRPHKNQRLLVEALDRLDPGLSLVLVGAPDPRMPDDVDDLVRRLGLGSRVHTIPSVPDRLLTGVYAGATAFLFPSLAEGYGIPPLEAMIAGIPVVASAIPVMAEVCADAALLVSPHDVDGWVAAVRRLIDEPELSARLVTRGREVARRATWQRGGVQLYELLTRVADDRPAR